MKLLNYMMQDGSRKFAELPQAKLWQALRDHLARFDGVIVTNFMTDNVTEGWIDFNYRKHSFTINDQFGDYWFLIDDPICADEVLIEIMIKKVAPFNSPSASTVPTPQSPTPPASRRR